MLFRSVVIAPVVAGAQTLALKRVMLSSGGVGYFEYEASVDGAADLKLTVRRDQVDDVLKSVVVYDDRGRVGSISLPGEDTTRALFRDLPFGPEALQNPVALLEAMRAGAVDIGYVGNVPLPEFAGPPKEVLQKLGLV